MYFHSFFFYSLRLHLLLRLISEWINPVFEIYSFGDLLQFRSEIVIHEIADFESLPLSRLLQLRFFDEQSLPLVCRERWYFKLNAKKSDCRLTFEALVGKQSLRELRNDVNIVWFSDSSSRNRSLFRRVFHDSNSIICGNRE